MHRISIRLPIWAALALAGAAYLVRSLVVRGGDFSIDKTDLVAAVVLAVGITLVAIVRRDS